MLIPFHDENPTTRWPIVTVAIIVINVLSLLYQDQLPARTGEGPHAIVKHVHQYGFVPIRLKQLTNKRPIRVDMYAAQVGRQVPLGPQRFIEFQPDATSILASAVTSMFLHAGWYHLLSNMWFFWIFGNNIEDRLGHVTFLLFYLVGGLIASLAHYLMSTEQATLIPVVGASGAVAVTLGAYAVFYPFAKVKTLVFLIFFFTVIELPALAILGFWFVGQLMSGMAPHVQEAAGVAFWAHIGGFVAGALLMPILAAGTPEPGSDWDREAAEQFGTRRDDDDWRRG
jgi:membrane associated rhomboid family serine protease